MTRIRIALPLVALLFSSCGPKLSQPVPPTHEVVEVPKQIITLLYQAPEPEPEPEPAHAKAKAAEEEGKAGAETGRVPKARARKSAVDGRQDIKETGLLAAFGDPSLAAMMGGGIDQGILESVGGLSGPKGVQVGPGGRGFRGSGPGGGGVEGTAIQSSCVGNIERCGSIRLANERNRV